MTTVHLSGNINHQTSPEARRRLLGELEKKDVLFVDLSDVNWMDSSGLAILVEVCLAARKNGQTVHIVNISQDIWGMVRLARLEGVFACMSGGENQTIH